MAFRLGLSMGTNCISETAPIKAQTAFHNS